jgi:hypothetical protein
MLYSATMQVNLRTAHLARYTANLIPMAWRLPADEGFLCPNCLNVIDLRFEDPEPIGPNLNSLGRSLNDAERVLASISN